MSLSGNTDIHTPQMISMATTGEGDSLGVEVVEVVQKELRNGMTLLFFSNKCILPLKLKKKLNAMHLEINI